MDHTYYVLVVVFAGLRLNNAWANGRVLRPFLQPESTLSSRSSVSGFKCKLRGLNSRPPYSRPCAQTTRLYAPSTIRGCNLTWSQSIGWTGGWYFLERAWRLCGSWMVRACGLEFGVREFESRSLHLKPETKLQWRKGALWLYKGS